MTEDQPIRRRGRPRKTEAEKAATQEQKQREKFDRAIKKQQMRMARIESAFEDKISKERYSLSFKNRDLGSLGSNYTSTLPKNLEQNDRTTSTIDNSVNYNEHYHNDISTTSLKPTYEVLSDGTILAKIPGKRGRPRKLFPDDLINHGVAIDEIARIKAEIATKQQKELSPLTSTSYNPTRESTKATTFETNSKKDKPKLQLRFKNSLNSISTDYNRNNNTNRDTYDLEAEFRKIQNSTATSADSNSKDIALQQVNSSELKLNAPLHLRKKAIDSNTTNAVKLNSNEATTELADNEFQLNHSQSAKVEQNSTLANKEPELNVSSVKRGRGRPKKTNDGLNKQEEVKAKIRAKNAVKADLDLDKYQVDDDKFYKGMDEDDFDDYDMDDEFNMDMDDFDNKKSSSSKRKKVKSFDDFDDDDISIGDDEDGEDFDDLDLNDIIDKKNKRIENLKQIDIQKVIIPYEERDIERVESSINQTTYESTGRSLESIGIKPYQFDGDEDDYMNLRQLNHIRNILLTQRATLIQQLEETKELMREDKDNYADDLDKASVESDYAISLRTRDRERQLTMKIDRTLGRIDNDPDFGYCEKCGDEIGIRRLEARPTAELCINCKTKAEIHERQQNG